MQRKGKSICTINQSSDNCTVLVLRRGFDRLFSDDNVLVPAQKQLYHLLTILPISRRGFNHLFRDGDVLASA